MRETDNIQISQQNQDLRQGDTSAGRHFGRLSASLYEYMLGHMQFAGRGGQFRTPRHIIRMTSSPSVASGVVQMPPLSLQEEFAGVVVRVEGLRGRMGEAGRQVEGLFESLLAKAFNE